jgi:DHA2 family multidrug resistance protein
VLRPEVAAQAATFKAGLIARGFGGDFAGAMTQKLIAGRTLMQGTVIGFDKTFILQAIAFVIVIPLLLFLRVKRAEDKVHVELSME